MQPLFLFTYWMEGVKTGGVQDALHESANAFLRRKLRFAEVFARHR
jgi:hypothetical protein